MSKWVAFDKNFNYEKIMYDILLPSGEVILKCWANNGFLDACGGRKFDTNFGVKVTPSKDFFE